MRLLLFICFSLPFPGWSQSHRLAGTWYGKTFDSVFRWGIDHYHRSRPIRSETVLMLAADGRFTYTNWSRFERGANPVDTLRNTEEREQKGDTVRFYLTGSNDPLALKSRIRTCLLLGAATDRLILSAPLQSQAPTKDPDHPFQPVETSPEYAGPWQELYLHVYRQLLSLRPQDQFPLRLEKIGVVIGEDGAPDLRTLQVADPRWKAAVRTAFAGLPGPFQPGTRNGQAIKGYFWLNISFLKKTSGSQKDEC